MTLTTMTRHILVLSALILFMCVFIPSRTSHVYAASSGARMDMIDLLNADRNLGEKAPVGSDLLMSIGTNPETRFPTITSINIVRADGVTPMVWIFGGIVAQAIGTGFQSGITLYMEGSSYAVKPLPNTLTPTSFLFIIPPLDSVKPQDPTYAGTWRTLCADGSIAQRVTVAMDAFPTRAVWLDAAIRYYLWERTSNIATTAFQVDAASGTPGEIRFQTPLNAVFGEGVLTLPVPLTYSGNILAAYGLIRLSNTGKNFIHLYSTSDNGSTQPGFCVYDEITEQVYYARAKGTPAAMLQLSSLPRSAKGTPAAISIWSRSAQMPDYGSVRELEESSITSEEYRYQSSFVGNSVAKLYELGSFILRYGADLSEVLAPDGNKSGLRLVTERGASLSTLSHVSRGDTLRIRSSNGGLGSGVTVAVYYTKTDVAVPESAIVPILETSSEDEIAFHVPSFKDKGTVRFALYAIPLEDKTKLEGIKPLIVFSETLSYVAEDKASPCFIATAAYGTPLASEIAVLRNFRDLFLLSNSVGTALVDTYYRFSPPLADWIAVHTMAASLVRGILWIVIGCVQAPICCGLWGIGFLIVWRTKSSKLDIRIFEEG